MRVLITGGGGFIGSHAVVETLQAGHEVSLLASCEFGHGTNHFSIGCRGRRLLKRGAARARQAVPALVGARGRDCWRQVRAAVEVRRLRKSQRNQQ